jgi:hypothetical protein
MTHVAAQLGVLGRLCAEHTALAASLICLATCAPGEGRIA